MYSTTLNVVVIYPLIQKQKRGANAPRFSMFFQKRQQCLL